MSRPTRKKKLRMWMKDPRCYFCGVETIDWIPPDGPGSKAVPDNAACLYHRRPRTDPDRLIPSYKTPAIRIVLACVKCNNEGHYRGYNEGISREVRRGLSQLKDRSQTPAIMKKVPSSIAQGRSE